MLPSSHSSDGCFSPSPHLIIQLDLSELGESPPVQRVQASVLLKVPPDQTYPSSISQEEFQPSLLLGFPSSHSSVPLLIPSPHTIFQVSLPAIKSVGSPSGQISFSWIEGIIPVGPWKLF